MINGTDYLVTVDNFFNYRGIDKLRYEKAFTTVRKVKRHFEEMSLLTVVQSSLLRSSATFQKNGISLCSKHRTSSPGHNQAKGKARAAVKTAKTA